MADGTKNISEMVNGLWEELQRKEPFTGSDADLSTSLQAYLQGVDIKTLWGKADGTRFKLEIELGNAAMQTGKDVASVLKEVALFCELDGLMVKAGHKHGIRDANGNTVGYWIVTT